jgi:hypothetical protein
MIPVEVEGRCERIKVPVEFVESEIGSVLKKKEKLM